MDVVMRYALQHLHFDPRDIVLYAWSIGGFTGTREALGGHWEGIWGTGGAGTVLGGILGELGGAQGGDSGHWGSTEGVGMALVEAGSGWGGH